ncbi:glucose-6-phosphate 1-dehydrogenase [Syntrophotalea carbinolica DSM 2380]|uniref:Glucose-6-phosphate 1-dehydrogenase n=1 Tax=Syntrophotalea carbinolica (strain DSM 2380 / NBRC 103641 / GraBd1) TaxID=338963 RepID=Q3A630_SYNC1|nr:glucose-6-phosphate dehydrogenase [Syntrophotalea carbinolica]ABA88177.1 glucose-6-phosphate 1-dehydrogenase [Syntrophotalea carbinolica DSM 2380]
MTEACTFVIFGATGDLARNKLLPALYHLHAAGRLNRDTRILASGRRHQDREAWLAETRSDLASSVRGGLSEEVFSRFADRTDYIRGDLNDAQFYELLHQKLSEKQAYPTDIAFYMALSPADYAGVIEKLDQVGLLEETKGWRRVVIEKPFGKDLQSAGQLQSQLARHLHEEQIFRIDHYLGKETVRNILVFRFGNALMEPLWNRNTIDHIQIIHAEPQGIGKRGATYENSGALRDMVQSHLLQLLTFVAMESPISMAADALHAEKLKVLKSIRPIPADRVNECAVRGQYAAGTVQGQSVVDYRCEQNVAADSRTETFAALKLHIDNWRWAGVPFLLRTGKRMAEKQALVAICFKKPPQQFFRASHVHCEASNWLLIGIQPHECMRLEMTVKAPGEALDTRQTSLDASFRRADETVNDAYEDLLLDIINGDRSLFLSYEEVQQAWRIVDPVLQAWEKPENDLHLYPAGSWGPAAADALFEEPCRFWRNTLEPCGCGMGKS